jgi:hypothetical protein
LESAPDEGRRRARQMIDTGEADLAQSVANGYSGLTGGVGPQDLRLMEELLAGAPAVVPAAIRALNRWRGVDPRTVIDLLSAQICTQAPSWPRNWPRPWREPARL